jgi:hypothetical protein
MDEEVVFVVEGSAGQVLERRRKGGTIYALRFRAYGERHYVTLGGEVEGWTRSRVRTELKPLSASSINKTIDVLRWILSVACEYGHISGNPAQGRRRRLREMVVSGSSTRRPRRAYARSTWCRFCATHSVLIETPPDTWPPTIPSSQIAAPSAAFGRARR